jgi:hypothetical protein
VVPSGYPSPLYDVRWDDSHRVARDIANHSGQGKKKQFIRISRAAR